jgi:hypothetical protein
MNRTTVHYDENKYLEDEDIGYESPYYTINIFDRQYLVCIGKERSLVGKRGHYYVPVYLMHKSQVYKQIGAFEYETNRAKTTKERQKPFLDKDGDLDLNRMGDLILYSFANLDFFNSLDQFETSQSMIRELEEATVLVTKKKGRAEEEDEEEDIFDAAKKKMAKTEAYDKTTTTLSDGVFETDPTVKLPDLLDEETKEAAKKAKADYNNSSRADWIEKHMKNNHYKIVETSSNGDCFFDCIRLAFAQVGQITTIAKLRALVAKELEPETYEIYRDRYNMFLSERRELEKESDAIKDQTKDLKRRIQKVTIKEEREKIRDTAMELAAKYKVIVRKQKEVDENMEDVAFMSKIADIDDFRKYIQTSSFWADDWAIGIIERKLQCKTIIFSESNYHEGDTESIILCGNDYDIAHPNFYIMVSHTTNHYRLVSYREKRILKFAEIPYDVKAEIIKKCMERNSGAFYKIDDFRSFKSRHGLDPDLGSPDEGAASSATDASLDVDPDTVFMYYGRSSNAKPGKGSGEKIDARKSSAYSNLAVQKDWRKKLDDEWTAAFTVDGHKWSTVEHYLQGAKFKKSIVDPKFYLVFSLDGDDKIGTDVELAKIAGSQTGKKKDQQLRPSNIKIDADYYGGREKEEREKALYAKFSQNEDLKQVLLDTRDAKLVKYVARSEPEVDTALMAVRHKLSLEGVPR